MKIDILTLFPDMYSGVFSESIIKRAIDEGKVEINIHNFRDFSTDPHNKVDDTPYGGGCGMVLTCQPIFDCVNSLKKDNSIVASLFIVSKYSSIIFLTFVASTFSSSEIPVILS